MKKSPSLSQRAADERRVFNLLRAAAGAVTKTTRIGTLLKNNPDFGKLEWMIAILAMEIDLRVEVPESLADAHHRTVQSFAKRVAALPRLDAPEYTLDRLTLLSQALLASDESASPSKRR